MRLDRGHVCHSDIHRDKSSLTQTENLLVELAALRFEGKSALVKNITLLHNEALKHHIAPVSCFYNIEPAYCPSYTTENAQMMNVACDSDDITLQL